MSDLELLIIDRARNTYPELMQRTDGEIIQLYRDGNIDIDTQDLNVDDVDMTYAQGDFNVEPQYRIRDQLQRDFIEGGILRDAYEGLGETYNQIRQSPLGQGIGSIKNFTTDIAGKGIDLGKIAVSGIGNMIAPGLGFVVSNLPQDSARNKFNKSFTVGGSNMPNDPYGYYSALRAGNLNQDPFGRNPVSMFGNYTKTLAQDANYTGTNKFNLAKKDFAENFFNENAINSGGVTIDNTVYSGPDYQGSGNNSGGGGGNITGSVSRGGTDDTEGTPFRRGGLASL